MILDGIRSYVPHIIPSVKIDCASNNLYMRHIKSSLLYCLSTTTRLLRSFMAVKRVNINTVCTRYVHLFNRNVNKQLFNLLNLVNNCGPVVVAATANIFHSHTLSRCGYK